MTEHPETIWVAECAADAKTVAALVNDLALSRNLYDELFSQAEQLRGHNAALCEEIVTLRAERDELKKLAIEAGDSLGAHVEAVATLRADKQRLERETNDRVDAAHRALEQSREREERLQEALRAIGEKRCNGCGVPKKRWGPICSGVTVGDFTHYHSPEWWIARALAVTAEETP